MVFISTASPPHPPTRHSVSLVVLFRSRGPLSTSTATNETYCLVGGLFQHSQSLVIHHTHQRDVVSRWWSSYCLPVPCQPPQPPTRHIVSLVVFFSPPGHSSATTPTNETRRLVGGLILFSRSLVNHHNHQRDNMSRWWSFSASRSLIIHHTHQRDTTSRWWSSYALPVPCRLPQPPTRHHVSLVVLCFPSPLSATTATNEMRNLVGGVLSSPGPYSTADVLTQIIAALKTIIYSIISLLYIDSLD